MVGFRINCGVAAQIQYILDSLGQDKRDKEKQAKSSVWYAVLTLFSVEGALGSKKQTHKIDLAIFCGMRPVIYCTL